MKNHKYTDYVCPICWHKLTECTCDFDNNNLIQIDEGMQYAIRELNKKGYRTECCCEGHYMDCLKGGDMYITFRQGSDPEGCPNGWNRCICKDEYHPTVLINHTIKSGSKAKSKWRPYFEEGKIKSLEALNRWVDSLPNNF